MLQKLTAENRGGEGGAWRSVSDTPSKVSRPPKASRMFSQPPLLIFAVLHALLAQVASLSIVE